MSDHADMVAPSVTADSDLQSRTCHVAPANSSSTRRTDQKSGLRSSDSAVAITFSPLFVRLCTKKARRAKASTKIEHQKQTAKRYEKENRDPTLPSRKMATTTASSTTTQVLPPTAVPPPPSGASAEAEWKENLNLTMMCPDCKEMPPNLVEEFSSGDMVCGSCGLVLGDRIVDTRSEWRTFSNDDQGSDDPSRVGDGANPLLNGSQLATSISFGDGGSGRGRELHRAQNKANHDKATKGLLAAYKEIGAFCDAINIPKNVSDTAKHLFKLVDDAKAFKGKPQEVLSAGCIFIACRQCGVPRTFREVFAVTKVAKKEIGRIFKALEKFFAAQNKEKMESTVQNGGVVNPNDSYTATTSTKAQQLCIRYCSHLGLSAACTKVSQALAEKMSSVGALAGRSPLSAAAACIYMTSALMKQPKSAKEISAVAGVSDGTIRTAYKFLYAEREKLIDPEWIKDGKGDMKLLPAS